MRKFSGCKFHFIFKDHEIDGYVSRPNKGGHTHNHIYNVLYRSTFHHGPRSVGANKPSYRQILLRGIEQFGYCVSKGKLIIKFDIKSNGGAK